MNSEIATFLTCWELAARWKKPKQWIYNNWRAQNIPAFHVGQQLRFSLLEIEKWEQTHTTI